MMQYDPNLPLILTYTNSTLINSINIVAYDNVNNPLSVSAFYLDATTNKYQIIANKITFLPQINIILNYIGNNATIYFESVTTTTIILMFTPQIGKNIITLTDLFCSYVLPVIPPMTANNCMGYTASASTYLSSNTIYDVISPPYYAFNDSPDTWVSAYDTYSVNGYFYGDSPSWLEIDIPGNVVIDLIYIQVVYNSISNNNILRNPTHFTFQGLINGTWTPIRTENSIDWGNNNWGKYFKFANTSPASKYRLSIPWIAYGAIPTNATNIVKLQLYSTSNFISYPLNSIQSFNSSPLIPNMNSNTFTYNYKTYISSASSVYNNNPAYAAFRAFDGIADVWVSGGASFDSNGNGNEWLEIDLPSSKIINCIYINSQISFLDRSPKNFIFQAHVSDFFVPNWANLLTINNYTNWLNVDGSYGTYFIIPNNNISVSKYRLNITAVNGSSVTSLANVQLYSM